MTRQLIYRVKPGNLTLSPNVVLGVKYRWGIQTDHRNLNGDGILNLAEGDLSATNATKFALILGR